MKVQDDRHPRRADAQRNIEAILTAARRCLAQDPDASVGAIAASAGVGRVTLYGHFPNRAHLVDAVVTRALAAFQDALESVDLSGDPHDALVRLVHAVWQPTAESARLIVAAERALPPERVLAAHEQPMRQVTAFIARGQTQHAFRTDLSASWLVSVFHSVVHAAANEVASGRLAAADAGDMIAATLLAAFERPANTRGRHR